MKFGRTVRGVARDERATRAARAKLALQEGKKGRRSAVNSIAFCRTLMPMPLVVEHSPLEHRGDGTERFARCVFGEEKG